jgi:hypothetical protein
MSANTINTGRDFTPAELLRIHEANCRIESARWEERNFRIAIMKRLGLRLGLDELRGLTMTGPLPTEPGVWCVRNGTWSRIEGADSGVGGRQLEGVKL